MYKIKIIASAFLTGAVYWLGGADVALKALIVAIVMDYVTGLLKAAYLKRLNSEIGLKGIIKKIGMLALVALAVLLDRATGDTGAVRTLVIYYLVANEGLSILENLGATGIKIPAGITKRLEQLKEKGDE